MATLQVKRKRRQTRLFTPVGGKPVLPRSISALTVLLALVLLLAGCGPADLGFQPPQPQPGELIVTYFDVGQGDASLLQTVDCTVLIDAGRHDRHDLVPHLEAARVDALDLLILTHPHADHIGQADQVLARWPVTEVWMSGWEHNTRTFERTLDAILASEASYHEPRSGEVYQCGSLTIQVLNPTDPLTDIHDGVAVRVVHDEVSLIWTGDAEVRHELNMISYGHDLRANVLHLGHHGSSTSTSPEFLQAVNPVVALYSAAPDNSYGHPHREIVERLDAADIPLFGTDRSGTIWLISDGRYIDLLPEKGDDR